MIFFGEQSLRRAATEFVRHYHGERNHQGLGNALIEPEERIGDRQGPVQRAPTIGRHAQLLLPRSRLKIGAR